MLNANFPSLQPKFAFFQILFIVLVLCVKKICINFAYKSGIQSIKSKKYDDFCCKSGKISTKN